MININCKKHVLSVFVKSRTAFLDDFWILLFSKCQKTMPDLYEEHITKSIENEKLHCFCTIFWTVFSTLQKLHFFNREMYLNQKKRVFCLFFYQKKLKFVKKLRKIKYKNRATKIGNRCRKMAIFGHFRIFEDFDHTEMTNIIFEKSRKFHFFAKFPDKWEILKNFFKESHGKKNTFF